MLALGNAQLFSDPRGAQQTLVRARELALVAGDEWTVGRSELLITGVAAFCRDVDLHREYSDGLPAQLENLSLGISAVMVAIYLAGLFFSLRTHKDLFNPGQTSEPDRPDWSVRRSVLTLAGAGVLVGVMSDLLVGSIEQASHDIGLSQFFVGVFVVAIVGNAAEHYVAIVVAVKDKMDLAVNIAIGSSAQIGLFVAPILVILSFAFGPAPMALVFNGYEIAALLLAALISTTLISDGESTWFEGVQLLAVYALLGLVFYYA